MRLHATPKNREEPEKELKTDSQSAVLRACRTLELMGRAARPAADAVKAVLATDHQKRAARHVRPVQRRGAA